MAAPPTRRTLGQRLGRSVNIAATGMANAIERGARTPAVPTRSISRDGSTIVIASTIEIVPGDGELVEGTPVAIPAGSWLGTVSAVGDWDDIAVGYVGLKSGGDVGAWVAHRPASDSESFIAGSFAVGLIIGPRTATPVATVSGGDGTNVDIVLTLVRAAS